MWARASRKVQEVARWMGVAYGPADWPAAFALSIFRTRPPAGEGALDRLVRRMWPFLWIRPKALRGLCVRLDPASMSHYVIFEEVFINGAYDLDQLAFEPDAVIDCGAFEGYFSLLARSRFAQAPVVAFEPNAANFKGLQANVRRNRLTIDARHAAVSTRDGEAQFAGGGCGGRLTGSADGDPGATVVVSDLRRVIAALAPKRLLLKLDIEGEELTLLPALLPALPRQCAVFFEWHHGVESFERLSTELTAAGFDVRRNRIMPQPDGTTFVDALAQRH